METPKLRCVFCKEPVDYSAAVEDNMVDMNIFIKTIKKHLGTHVGEPAVVINPMSFLEIDE